MPQIERSALVMYSAQQMYDLVNDVNSYAEFIPNCADVKVLSSTDTQLEASLKVSKGFLNQWFTTKNHMTPGQTIAMELVDGPFRALSGGWQFLALDENACKIIFKLDFEFSSKMVEGAFGRVFKQLVANMVDAFTQRAKQVYGEAVF